MHSPEARMIVVCFMILLAWSLGFLSAYFRDDRDSGIVFWFSVAPFLLAVTHVLILFYSVARLVYLNL